VKELFRIENNTNASDARSGWLSIGPGHMVMAAGTNEQLFQLRYLGKETAGGWTDADLNSAEALLSGMLQPGAAVKVAFCFPETMLTPYSITEAGAAAGILGLSGQVQSTQVPAWQVTINYAVPVQIMEWVERVYGSVAVTHFSVPLLQHMRAGEEAGMLLLDIGRDTCTIIAGKNGQLLLVQAYPWSVAEDILFYLLKTVETFSFSQQATAVQVSGLVDTDSALYKELYQYFIHIELRSCNWSTGPYPSHFFTALNDFAACG